MFRLEIHYSGYQYPYADDDADVYLMGGGGRSMIIFTGYFIVYLDE